MQHIDPHRTPEGFITFLATPTACSLSTQKPPKQVPAVASKFSCDDGTHLQSGHFVQAVVGGSYTRPIVVLRGKQVDFRLGISRSARYEKLDPSSPRYDPTFPKPISLGASSIGFLEHEVDTWIQSRIAASRSGANGGGLAK